MLHRRSLFLVGIFAVAMTGCGHDDDDDRYAPGSSSGSNPEPPTPTCADGFAYDVDARHCRETVPPSDCPAGTMPEIGHAECVPVGWIDACPEGFVTDPSGWGCRDRAPATGCPGATREHPGSATCVAIGDCAAPFPPAEATVFVDDDFTDAQIDAAHFKSLSAAAAGAPEGSVIAVESGTYTGIVSLTHSVTIVGRCAEEVVIRSPVGGLQTGLYVPGTTGIAVRGVTVSGFPGGVYLEGGELVLEDAVIDDNAGAGVYLRFDAKVTMRRSKVSRTGTTGGSIGGGVVVYDDAILDIEDSAIVDNAFRNVTADGGAKVTTTGTFIARNGALSASEPACGVAATDLGVVELSRSVVADAQGSSALVMRGGRIELSESILRRSFGTLDDVAGFGILAVDGGIVHATSSVISEHPVVGVYAGDAGTEVSLTTSIIREGLDPAEVEFGRGAQSSDTARLALVDTAIIGLPQSGVAAQGGGQVSLEHVLVRDTGATPTLAGFGVVIETGSQATFERSSIVSSTMTGLAVSQDATTTATATFIASTREFAPAGIGTAAQVSRGGRLDLIRCALSGNTGTTAITTQGGLLRLESSTVHGTTFNAAGDFAHGLTVFLDAQLELVDTAIYENPGIGLAADGARAWTSGDSSFTGNAVAVHAQGGSALEESASLEPLGPREVRISPTTRFEGNGAKIGSGTVALPKPFE